MINKKIYVNINVINGFLFFYFIIMPFLFVTKKQEYIIALMIAIIGYISFTLAVNLKIKHKDFLKNAFNDTKLKRIIFYSFIALDLLKIILLLVNGIDQNAYNISYSNAAGSNSLYFMIIQKTIEFIKLYIYSGYICNNKKTFYKVFIISLIASFSSRVRLDIVKIIVFFVIYGIYFDYIKINLIKVVTILFTAPFIMLATLIKRDFVGSANILNIITNIKITLMNIYINNDLIDKFKMAMESFETFEIYNNVVVDNLIMPMNGIIRIIFNFIPRSIWLEKPYPLQVMLAYEYNKNAYYAGGGIFANLYGDAYLNGGIISVILILFILGIISRKIYKSSLTNKKSKSVNVGMYCVFITFFMNFYRGYLSDMTWQFLLFLIVFKAMNKLEKTN